jgi:hypothetical protein
MARRRRYPAPALIWLTIVLLASVTFYQTYDWYRAKTDRTDAAYYLYQVSLFDLQMLAGTLAEAGKLTDTSQLDALREAAYSAQYSHERLARIYAKENMAALDSYKELLQFVLGLQLGGPQAIKPETAKTMRDLSGLYREMSADYAKLLSARHEIISSENAKLVKIDGDIVKLLRQKQLGE